MTTAMAKKAKRIAEAARKEPPHPPPEFLLDSGGQEVRVGDFVRHPGLSSLGARIAEVVALRGRSCVVCFEAYGLDNRGKKLLVPPVYLASMLLRVGGPDYSGPRLHDEKLSGEEDAATVTLNLNTDREESF